MFFSPWRKLLKKRYVVNLFSGRAFHGILMEHTREYLTLRDVVMMDPDITDPIPVDGEVLVPMSEVEFLQKG